MKTDTIAAFEGKRVTEGNIDAARAVVYRGCASSKRVVNSVFLSVLMAPIRMSVEKTVPALAEGDTLSRLQSLVQNVELLAMALGAGALGLLNLLLIPKLLGRWSVDRLGALGFAIMCLGLVVMGSAGSAWVYVGAFLGAMAGAAWFNVFNRTQRVKAIEPEHLGKVIGPFYLINCLSYPIAGLLTASLGPVLGVQRMVLFMALVLALPGSLLLWRTALRFRALFEGQAVAAQPASAPRTTVAAAR